MINSGHGKDRFQVACEDLNTEIRNKAADLVEEGSYDPEKALTAAFSIVMQNRRRRAVAIRSRLGNILKLPRPEPESSVIQLGPPKR